MTLHPIQAMLSSFILLSLFVLSSFTTPTYASLGLVYSFCSTTDNYTDGSTFRSNLDLFLSSIAENTVNNEWFYNDTAGKSPNQVYGMGMCYYDATSSGSCMSCLAEAAVNITMWCAHSTNAALWYSDCFLIYSNENFFSVENLEHTLIVYSTVNASDPETFKQVLGDLMNKLTKDVASLPKLVAVGEANYTTFQKIYGLVECTRDLSALACQKCLRVDISWIPGYCRDGIGCEMFGPSCHLRYEVNPFYKPMVLTPPPPPPMLPSSPVEPVGYEERKKSKTIYVIIGTACTIPLLLITMIGVFLLIRRQRRKIGTGPNPSIETSSAQAKESNFERGTELMIFNFSTLRDATNNFSDENTLGEGGFGKVYKGKVNGRDLAVKRLATISAQGITQLKNEVEFLGRLKHKNLVQVLGYCIQEEEKLLCYEYLPNGSLDRILFATDIWRRKMLNWMARFSIIEGICRSLVYLHVESGETIIHRDLKASNILLDKNMNPKISDFGLARLFSGDNTHISTIHVAGTIGYIAPESIMHFMFSPKSDIFSFGVLILEIVTGQRSNTNLISYVWQHWIKKEIVELIDPALPEMNIDQIAKCIHIGLLCVQENPDNRPSILDVNNMLHNHPSSLRPLPPGNLIWRAQMASNFEDSIYSTSTEYTMDEFYHRQSIHSR